MADLELMRATDGAVQVMWRTELSKLPTAPGTDIVFKCRRSDGSIYHVIEDVGDDGNLVNKMHWERDILGWIELPARDHSLVAYRLASLRPAGD